MRLRVLWVSVRIGSDEERLRLSVEAERVSLAASVRAIQASIDECVVERRKLVQEAGSVA